MVSYASPQTLNRYSYVSNNPLRYTDPTGHMLDAGTDGAGSVCPDQACKDDVQQRRAKKHQNKIPGYTATVAPIVFGSATPIPTFTSMTTNLMTVPAQCTSSSPCIGNFVPSATPSPTSTPYNVVATAGAGLANTAKESFRNNCLVPSLGSGCGHALQDMHILSEPWGDAIDAVVYTGDEINNSGSRPPTQREKIDGAVIGGLSAVELTTLLISMFIVP